MPLVSVIIPTHNRAHLVERAVLSVLRQTFKDFELLVVDDGSTDATPEVLSGFRARLKPLFQENTGVSSARNMGIRHSGGELVAFLDSDDEWRPTKLERQVDLFRGGRPNFICHTDETWIRNGKEVAQGRVHRKQGGRFFRRALKRCLISPSAVMISRELLDSVGWFDEELPAAEDYDLWLRITAFHEVDFIEEPLVIKHGGAHDQLSRTVPAIDRFRIRSIIKILADPRLSGVDRIAAVQELIGKCEIVASGCAKRGKMAEARHYRELAESYKIPESRSR